MLQSTYLCSWFMGLNATFLYAIRYTSMHACYIGALLRYMRCINIYKYSQGKRTIAPILRQGLL